MNGMEKNEPDNISYLIKRFLSGKLTSAEQLQLDQWLDEKPEHQLLFSRLTEEHTLTEKMRKFSSINRQAIWDKTMEKIEADRKVRFSTSIKLWPRIAVAASILLVLSIGLIFLVNKQSAQHITRNVEDIGPGRDQVTLTLSNGKQIVISKGVKDQLRQSNATVSINAGKAITYLTNNQAKAAKTGYNMLTTKRGEQSPCPLVLSDGTKVWLNAASSIKFPEVFTGNDRNVSITGEVYFEVAHNVAKPFSVSANGQVVEVLGTHFNINTYTDEPFMKTTLLEGSIKVSTGNNSALIKPGQQVQLPTDGINRQFKILEHIDADDVVAWRDGKTSFDNADIKTIMRQAARWYNIEVEYRGKISNQLYTGALSRSAKFSGLLNILKLNDIRYEFHDRKLTIIN
jgi:transmembrane sensor